MMMMRYLVLSLFLVSFAQPVAAQQTTHACASVVEPAARLACYDQAFPPPPAVLEAAVDKAQANFGLEQPRDPLRNPGQTTDQADPDRIESRVAKVDQGRDGQRVLTLANGQVWAQTESRSSGHVQSGDVVQVRKAAFGGYHLVMPNGVVVRVRRTR